MNKTASNEQAAAVTDQLDARLAGLAQSMEPYRQGMVESLASFAEFPSVKGAGDRVGPFGEQTVLALDAFLMLGQRLGFKAANLDNRAGYVEYGDSGPIIAVLGHLDVVPAGGGWTTEPFDRSSSPDRVIARGAIDDKGPVIAALYAMKALHRRGFSPECPAAPDCRPG